MSLVRRLLNVLRVLLEAHLTVARTEAQRDFSRVFLGVVLLAMASACLCTAWMLLHVVALLLLRDAGYNWGESLLGVIGGDVVVAIALSLLARNRLSKPMLVETRALLQKTVEALVG